jgi:PKD repeat protein
LRCTGRGWLTDDPAPDAAPAWSPDGGAIVFVSTRWSGDHELAVMRADGSGVTRLGGGIVGWGPAWSPDGSLIAFTSYDNQQSEFGIGIFTVHADGTSVDLAVSDATDAAWVPSFAGVGASFGIYCSDWTLTCSFDASSSVGSITDYAWSFGDGTTGSGEFVSHTYADGGDLSIELRVTDTRGRAASRIESIHLNRRPVASLTVSCDKFSTCLFDATASYDPDGSIAGVQWGFGDGTGSGCGGNCLLTSHTYAAPGTYTTTVVITDNGQFAATVSRTITVGPPAMHVGDLDSWITTQPGMLWSAFVRVMVHTASHEPLANAVVNAKWNDGPSASCTTTTTGTCVISRSRLRAATVTLMVTGINRASFVYDPASNNDPDGDSNGTSISIARQ